LQQQHALHLQPSFDTDESEVENTIDLLTRDIEDVKILSFSIYYF